MGFDIEINRQGIQTTHLQASHCHYCHYCNVDFVLFHNVTCYIDSLSPRIHVNNTNLLNITCTLVPTKRDITELRVYIHTTTGILHIKPKEKLTYVVHMSTF